MPGLVGIVGQRGAGEAQRQFSLACDRMLRHEKTTSRSLSAFGGSCLLGRVVLPPEVESAEGRPQTALFHGVLYNERALRDSLRSSGPAESIDELIAALYLEHGPQFVERLEGEFCLALVDLRNHIVLVASDTVGSYPIYWAANAGGLVFASDLSALLKALPATPRLDLRAVADYLTLGAVLADRTLAEGVRLLNPGTVLTYDIQKAQVSHRSYARIETFFQEKATDKAAYFEAVAAAFKEAVLRATSSPLPIGLSLSGGLDSRAILSAVPRSVALRTYTLGVEGCADQVIARELSEIAGTKHFFFRLDSSYLKDFLPNMARMVSITDGMYLSHGLTEMLAIQFLDQTGIGVLLRGHGGELAKAHLAWPLHTDARVHDMTSLDELAPYLSRRANYITTDLPLSQVLTPEAARRAGDGTAQTFVDLLAGTGLSPADGCSYLYLRELHRRFTVPSIDLFRTRLEVRLPYVDPKFLRVLLAAPSKWRDSTEIHSRITAAGTPKLVKVRNSNTGARADAGPREEFVMDKLNTILKRLNVSGYRHYHNFSDWMSKSLIETVETELLSPAARIHGLVSRERLAELTRESREGRANRSYLLQILLILELWLRENNVDSTTS